MHIEFFFLIINLVEISGRQLNGNATGWDKIETPKKEEVRWNLVEKAFIQQWPHRDGSSHYIYKKKQPDDEVEPSISKSASNKWTTRVPPPGYTRNLSRLGNLSNVENNR